jgi:hypothetical protein
MLRTKNNVGFFQTERSVREYTLPLISCQGGKFIIQARDHSPILTLLPRAVFKAAKRTLRCSADRKAERA